MALDKLDDVGMDIEGEHFVFPPLYLMILLLELILTVSGSDLVVLLCSSILPVVFGSLQ